MPAIMRVHPSVFGHIRDIRAREVADGYPLMFLGMELAPTPIFRSRASRSSIELSTPPLRLSARRLVVGVAVNRFERFQQALQEASAGRPFLLR